MIAQVLTVIAALFLAAGPPLADPRQEARAQKLMREIRCVACENEPISQSGSEIAVDMEARVRQLVESGPTDADIRAQFAALYGERVLFRPQVRTAGDYLLWGLPFGLVLIGGLGIYMASRGRRAKEVEAVEPDRFDAN